MRILGVVCGTLILEHTVASGFPGAVRKPAGDALSTGSHAKYFS